MKKLLIVLILIFSLFINTADFVSADYPVAEPSAQIKVEGVNDNHQKGDYRVSTLKTFLEGYNSPLANSADQFVAKADRYQLDWRLVPAITGVESTFGKRIPSDSYNAYGWANGVYKFESWDNSIEIVSRALREKYIDRGAVTIDQIARRYAPPSSTWSWKVQYFMNKIDPLPLSFTI